MAALHSPSTATSRRVLGHLAPNMKIAHAPVPIGQTATPKSTVLLSSQASCDKENLSQAGSQTHSQPRKRSISEVDEVEHRDASSRRRCATTDSAAGVTRSVKGLVAPASPTEVNTPSPKEPEPLLDRSSPSLEAPPDTHDSQPSQESFSTWVEWGNCASQKSVHDQTPSQTLPEPRPAKDEDEDRKEQSRAKLLRTRLGFASYKVRTEQITKLSSDIISNWESSSPSSYDQSNSFAMPSFAGSSQAHVLPSAVLSPVRRDPPEFVSIAANLDPYRPIGKLTPAPVLLPTATSSRKVHDYQMPSSPPQAHLPGQSKLPEE